MKRIALWVVLGLSVVAVGCIVPSVYPFYTEKDLVFDPGLVGTWAKVKGGGDDNEMWEFEKSGQKDYNFLMKKGSETNVFSAHLFKLKDNTFMDCMLVQGLDLCIPPHYLLKVAHLQPALKISTLNFKWLNELLEKQPDAIRHTMVFDKPGDTNTEHVVLTADTRELQKFILKHLDNTNAFVDLDEMKRLESKDNH